MRRVAGVVAKVGATGGVAGATFTLFHHTMSHLPPEQRKRMEHDFRTKFPTPRLMAPKPGGSSWSPF